MNPVNPLAKGLHSFFDSYLIQHRNLSRQTVLAYRDAIKLLLRFTAEHHQRSVADLDMEHLTPPVILAFLEHLETHRKVSPSTRNHRLAAIHSLFRHLAGLDPRHFHQCQQVLAIPFKRCGFQPVGYLTKEELTALLAQPDRNTVAGERDYVLLSLLYNTGCRVQELLDLCPGDFTFDNPAFVRIQGKGRKERLCPLWPQTAALVKGWLLERGESLRSERPLFWNQRGEPMTRFGVRHLLKTYQKKAAPNMPSLGRKDLHPHTLRHTTAVHLLQSGVEVNLIRTILGHASITTTNRYAEIDLEMKRKALDQANSGASDEGPSAWKKDRDLLTWLESL